MSPRLSAVQLTKSFGDCVSVDDVSLDFEPGRIHAVLGENGAGKTTLMKLLFGLLEPSHGEIHLDGKAVRWQSSMDAIKHGLGMVQQHFTLVETLSVIDNIMLGAEVCKTCGILNRQQAIQRLEKLIPSAHLSLPWYALVEDLTVGQKQRLEILKLLFRESQILFLDEPTAVLTPFEIEDFFTILRQLKAQGRTIVLITHKIAEVMQVCDTYSVLRAGKLRGRGDVSKSSQDEIVEAMIGRRLPEFDLQRRPVTSNNILELQDVSDIGHYLKDIRLHVKAGEIVGIAGVEGSGQTELVDAIMGLEPFTGQIQLLGETLQPLQAARVRSLGTGLVPEDRLLQGLWASESCSMNLAIGLEERFLKREIFQFKELVETTNKWAAAFDVRAPSMEMPVASLSGGNQQKIIFAREVNGRAPRFLLCHQPTRGVDLGAIDLIHRRLIELRNEGLGVLLISSELEELLKLCDRIYVMFEGKLAREFAREEFARPRIGQAMTGVQDASAP